jgi:hypothetical protein|nr:hypothetical protein [uncultured Comamonas sp.]
MILNIPPINATEAQFEEFWRSCLSNGGPRIGRGTTRDVYEIPGHPDKVLKVCSVPSNYSNWAESVIYNSAGDFQQCLAEVISISWSGKFLVMERLTPGVTANELASELANFPWFLNDKKPSNFGKTANGKIKMLDFAMLSF